MRRFGLYESAPVWPAERYAPAKDGFVLIQSVEPGQVVELDSAVEAFELQHRRFVENLPRPHKLSLHLGVSFHPLETLHELSDPASGTEPMRYCGTQGLLPPTCLLQEWVIEEVSIAVEKAFDSFEEQGGLAPVREAGGSALLRLSIHVFEEQLEAEMTACTYQRGELPQLQPELVSCN